MFHRHPGIEKIHVCRKVFHRTSGIEKFHGEEGGIDDFLSNFLCLTVPKNFVGEPNSVLLFLGIDIIYASGGYVTVFCRK